VAQIKPGQSDGHRCQPHYFDHLDRRCAGGAACCTPWFARIDPFVGFTAEGFRRRCWGIGNITGALLGGLVLGMLETFAGSYLSVFTMGAMGAEYKDILAFAILILVLIFRPAGLLGEQVAQKA
jgi:branched-chain amino acid transport system permease protein